jgi:hypothetical protein
MSNNIPIDPVTKKLEEIRFLLSMRLSESGSSSEVSDIKDEIVELKKDVSRICDILERLYEMKVNEEER